jgi:ABC-type nitrate/sulfonate/bicarbonate transport system permease component
MIAIALHPIGILGGLLFGACGITTALIMSRTEIATKFLPPSAVTEEQRQRARERVLAARARAGWITVAVALAVGVSIAVTLGVTW